MKLARIYSIISLCVLDIAMVLFQIEVEWESDILPLSVWIAYTLLCYLSYGVVFRKSVSHAPDWYSKPTKAAIYAGYWAGFFRLIFVTFPFNSNQIDDFFLFLFVTALILDFVFLLGALLDRRYCPFTSQVTDENAYLLRQAGRYESEHGNTLNGYLILRRVALFYRCEDENVNREIEKCRHTLNGIISAKVSDESNERIFWQLVRRKSWIVYALICGLSFFVLYGVLIFLGRINWNWDDSHAFVLVIFMIAFISSILIGFEVFKSGK